MSKTDQIAAVLADIERRGWLVKLDHQQTLAGRCCFATISLQSDPREEIRRLAQGEAAALVVALAHRKSDEALLLAYRAMKAAVEGMKDPIPDAPEAAHWRGIVNDILSENE